MKEILMICINHLLVKKKPLERKGKKTRRSIFNTPNIERWNWNKSIFKNDQKNKSQLMLTFETGDSSYETETKLIGGKS